MRSLHPALAIAVVYAFCVPTPAQTQPLVSFRPSPAPQSYGDSFSQPFPIVADGKAAAIYVDPRNPETVRVAAEAFAADVEKVTGVRPALLTSLDHGPSPNRLIVVGVLGQSGEIDALVGADRVSTENVAGKWEAAVTAVVPFPNPGTPKIADELVVAGADRRGVAYALFAISRAMGVSPWNWWADVPVAHHAEVYVTAGEHKLASPSVQYRGIFFNDEDWGLRPWAAKKMDPAVDSARGSGEQAKGNIGPHTYERVFELLLRLHANSLWPAMHPGSLAFNAVPENARLANKWGIVMGSSHSEALLRNNVGEWSEKAPPAGDGPWNYQTNSAAMRGYWAKRLEENGKYENFYTVGLRGLHDSGLEATGTRDVKARLVEQVMRDQQALLAKYVNPDVAKIPQVIWLYKESLDLYRAGMKVPPDVTLGWTDDNYGYIRELPTAEEQKRPGGSGIYYHVSYWGAPHDYLWLCTTPPALLGEELTKAYEHGVRKYWILNVGDLKPAEIDIDYFLQLAADEPGMAQVSQQEFLTRWLGEQFGAEHARDLASILDRAYALDFIRKPEFMGFNGYNDDVKRTAFNPLAWGQGGLPGENQTRAAAWSALSEDAVKAGERLPAEDHAAFFELVGYPVEAAAAMNHKFLSADLTYLDAHEHNAEALAADAKRSQEAYARIQALTAEYNGLEGGKWDGMMSDHPRDRHVFEMPTLATMADADEPLPASWGAGEPVSAPIAPGFIEQDRTVSINAAHFTRKLDGGAGARWNVLPELGISRGGSVVYGSPGVQASLGTGSAEAEGAPWLEYAFTTMSEGPATLTLHLLPTFPVDSEHRLRYAVQLDDHPRLELDAAPVAAAPGGAKASGDGPSDRDWAQNVLRNSAVRVLHLSTPLAPGAHTIRLYYVDPGVVFEHLVLTFDGAPPAYPVPPETGSLER